MIWVRLSRVMVLATSLSAQSKPSVPVLASAPLSTELPEPSVRESEITKSESVEVDTKLVPSNASGTPVVKDVALVPPLEIASVPVVSESAIESEDVAKSAHAEPFQPKRSPKFSVIAATSERVSMESSVRSSSVSAPSLFVNMSVTSEMLDSRFASVMELDRLLDPSVATRRLAVRLESVTVPVAERFAVLSVLDMRALPCTEKSWPGVVVPMPKDEPPKRRATPSFGSKLNSPEVVAVEPTTSISVVLTGWTISCPDTCEVQGNALKHKWIRERGTKGRVWRDVFVFECEKPRGMGIHDGVMEVECCQKERDEG